MPKSRIVDWQILSENCIGRGDVSLPETLDNSKKLEDELMKKKV